GNGHAHPHRRDGKADREVDDAPENGRDCDARQLGEERYGQAGRERDVLERDFEGDRPTIRGRKARGTSETPAQQDGNGEGDENRGQRDAGEAAEDADIAQEQNPHNDGEYKTGHATYPMPDIVGGRGV